MQTGADRASSLQNVLSLLALASTVRSRFSHSESAFRVQFAAICDLLGADSWAPFLAPHGTIVGTILGTTRCWSCNSMCVYTPIVNRMSECRARD